MRISDTNEFWSGLSGAFSTATMGAYALALMFNSAAVSGTTTTLLAVGAAANLAVCAWCLRLLIAGVDWRSGPKPPAPNFNS
jgi:hypothetical protein